jgi:hypothetical protein
MTCVVVSRRVVRKIETVSPEFVKIVRGCAGRLTGLVLPGEANE